MFKQTTARISTAVGKDAWPLFTTRLCLESDVGRVAQIEEECFGSSFALSRLALTQYLHLFRSAFHVAQALDDVVGFAIGGVTMTDRAGWLLDLAIMPDMQGKGIGRRLATGVIVSLEGMGIQRILATVSPQNVRSLGLLESLGFRPVEDVADYFGPGERRLVLVRANRTENRP